MTKDAVNAESETTTIQITYDANKGKVSKDSKAVVYGQRYGTLPVPTRKGHVFAGWYTKKKNGKRILSDQQVSVTSDITLYARWITKNAAKERRGLSILMYHWFYDKDSYTPSMKKDGNWMDIKEFEKHMKYLKKKGYYFPSWKEVNQVASGKLVLPKKSVVVTVDDGKKNFFTLAVPILKKYDIHATSFLITSKTGKKTIKGFTSEYVEFRSHTHDLHIRKSNGDGVAMTKPISSIKKDLKKSKKKLGKGYVLCYPFGHYNKNFKKALKKEGFKLAVTTNSGKVKYGTNKLELPRMRVSSGTSLSEFKKKL